MERNEKAFEWAEKIPLEELFAYLTRLTGISDLNFSHRIREDRYGMPKIEFETQDLVDRVGFLRLLFKSIEISNFNSEVHKRDGRLAYWGTAAFSYTHPSGGSNGHTFLTFWYDDLNGWQFQEEQRL